MQATQIYYLTWEPHINLSIITNKEYKACEKDEYGNYGIKIGIKS